MTQEERTKLINEIIDLFDILGCVIADDVSENSSA